MGQTSNLKTAVSGLKMAHLPKIALAFEFSSDRPVTAVFRLYSPAHVR
jgi:hypothetical protein